MKKIINNIVRKLKQKKHLLGEVFTPSSAAKLTFVDRQEINQQIDRALLIKGMQLIIFGHSGSGKTTLIQNNLNNKEKKFITTNCILDTTISEIILDAFDKLNPFFTSEKVKSSSTKIGADLTAGYFALDATIKSEIKKEYSEKKERVLPIQLTPQRLAEFLGAARVTWIIEDFHKVKKEEREKFSQMLKIFVDTSNRFEHLKVIAIGAVGTAREIVNYDSELNNRISEIFVPLMNKNELMGIINKGEELLNIDFGKDVRSKIITFSNSLASICHHLCFSICYSNQIQHSQKSKKRFRADTIRDAVIDYVKQNSDSFKETLDKALRPRDGKFDNTKGILNVFCKLEKEELSKGDILHYKSNKKTYKNNIEEYLRLLTTAGYGEILRFDDNSGKYSFSNPFFLAYVRMKFSTEEKEVPTIQYTQSVDFEELMKYFVIRDVEVKVERKRKE